MNKRPKRRRSAWSPSFAGIIDRDDPKLDPTIKTLIEMTEAAQKEYAEKQLNFLDHYFSSVLNKLEADAVLFNRKLPHAGLVGTENELALSTFIREFLPPRFGIEVSGIVIDRFGGESKQCDIILYDTEKFPKYLRKVFPIELVYGVIEVKTMLTSTEARTALANLQSVFALDFRTALTPYWETKSKQDKIPPSQPPFGMIFSYRSEAKSFETFSRWFPSESVYRGIALRKNEINAYPEANRPPIPIQSGHPI